MKKKRRSFSSEKKASIALEAMREHETSSEIARKHEVQSAQVVKWKEHAISNLKVVFEKSSQADEQSARESKLFEEVGRLQVELSFLKKKLQSKGLV